MSVIQSINNILDGVVVVVKDIIKKTKLNYVEIGVIVKCNEDDDGYTVKINNSITEIKSLHGIKYKENDIVYILIMNQDFTKKLILDKVY